MKEAVLMQRESEKGRISRADLIVESLRTSEPLLVKLRTSERIRSGIKEPWDWKVGGVDFLSFIERYDEVEKVIEHAIERSNPYMVFLHIRDETAAAHALLYLMWKEPTERRKGSFLLFRMRGNQLCDFVVEIFSDFFSPVLLALSGDAEDSRIAAVDMPIPLDVTSYQKYGKMAIIASTRNPCRALLKNHLFVRDLVDLDMVESLPFDDDTVRLVMLRLSSFILEGIDTPVVGLLARYVRLFYEAALVSSVSRSLLSSCLSIVKDSTLGSALLLYGDDFRLGRLNDKSAAYVAGFPVDLVNPWPGLKEDLISHKNNRPSPEVVRQLNLRKLRLLIDDCLDVYPDVSVVNEKDTLYNSIEDYMPLDIVRYCSQNGKIFQFSRSEFDHLLKTELNPFTNERLPEGVLTEMKIRHFGEGSEKPPVATVQEMQAPLFDSCAVDVPAYMRRTHNLPTVEE